MESYKIIISELAYGDMGSIKNYIRNELKDGDAAERIIDQFYEQIIELATMPKRHMPISDVVLSYEMRKIRVGNYYIFYGCNEAKGEVTVVRVLYCKREWENLL